MAACRECLEALTWVRPPTAGNAVNAARSLGYVATVLAGGDDLERSLDAATAAVAMRETAIASGETDLGVEREQRSGLLFESLLHWRLGHPSEAAQVLARLGERMGTVDSSTPESVDDRLQRYLMLYWLAALVTARSGIGPGASASAGRRTGWGSNSSGIWRIMAATRKPRRFAASSPSP